MDKKKALACLVVIFAISFVAMVRLSQNNEVRIALNETAPLVNRENTSINKEENVTQSISSSTLPSLTQTFTQHNTTTDCWIVYQGKIYDITSYLPRHPGGEQKIAQFCGTTQFEEAFLKKHGTSKVTTLMKVGVFIGDFDVKGKVA